MRKGALRMTSRRWPFVLVLLLAASTTAMGVGGTHAASQTDYSNAMQQIGSAFSATYTADMQGGNVTSLVSQLNGALQLVSKAASENSTQPTQASTDLQQAVTIAKSVQAAAGGVGQTGAAARQTQLYISVGSAAVIIAIASLVYVFGDRIYRRLWLRVYGNYEVKKIG